MTNTAEAVEPSGVWWEQRRENESLDDYMIRVLRELWEYPSDDHWEAVITAVREGEFGDFEDPEPE